MVNKRKAPSGAPTQQAEKNDAHASHSAKHRASQRGLALHRISGPVPWSPASVVSMSASRDGSLCAAVREDGRVDLYGGERDASLSFVKSIPSWADASPSSIVVVDGDDLQQQEKGTSSRKVRMFVGGMDGTITELDSGRRQARLVCDSYGGAVWGLAALAVARRNANVAGNDHDDRGDHGDTADHDDTDDGGYSHRLAAACDDGSVKVFGVDADGSPGVTLIKSFLPVDGRVLCVAWDESRGRVVSGGSDGCVHVWDGKTGQELMRITVGGGNSKNTRNDDKTARPSAATADDDDDVNAVCVWAVKVLGDGTIVSGDSLGQVTFWDGRFGTMLAKFNPNGADVLALEASEDGGLVFSSGIDPRIAVFRRVIGDAGANDTSEGGNSARTNTNANEWAYLSSKQEHVLDVRALCVCGGRLLSGGNDALVVSHSVVRFLKEHPRRVDAVPTRPLISRAGRSDAGMVMASGVGSGLDVWALRTDGARRHQLVNVARLERSRRAELTAVATSSDGRYVAFGDIHGAQCVELRDGVGAEDLIDAPGIVPVVADSTDGASKDAGMMAMAVVDVRRDEIGEGVTHLEFVDSPTAKGVHQLVACLCDGTIKVVGGIGTESVTVHTIRDVHDLRYKTWFKRESGKSAARRAAPVVESVRVRMPTSRAASKPKADAPTTMMAVVVLNRIFLLNLDTRKVSAQISSVPGTITAVEFVQDGAKLLVATTGTGADASIGLFDASSGDMCAFAGVAEPAFHDLALEGMGPVLGIEAMDANCAVVYSSHALVHLNLSRKLADEESALAGLGRRTRDKRIKFDALRSEHGRNPRVIRYEQPILACTGGHLIGGDLVMVEGSYEQLWRGKLAPLKKHRYGT